jgi:hypothetical protein
VRERELEGLERDARKTGTAGTVGARGGMAETVGARAGNGCNGGGAGRKWRNRGGRAGREWRDPRRDRWAEQRAEKPLGGNDVG